jgi:hypothetical protein
MAINAISRRHARPSSPSPQADLFTAPNGLPEGLCYRPNVLSGDEEDGLARELADLPFKRCRLGGAHSPERLLASGRKQEIPQDD